MPHVRIETSVPRHPKFLKAGPVACWLWLCGLTYCQEGLTDGFIPREAVQALGLNVSRSVLRDAIAKLVEVRLWDECDGGWRVHDYLAHNRSAQHVREIKATNSQNAKGKRRSGSVSESLSESPAQSLSDAVIDTAVAAGSWSQKEKGDPQFDVWFQQIEQDYPQQRVTSGWATQTAFMDALTKHPEGPYVAWGLMQANLDNQKRGHEWRVKRMIPKLENWLRSGAWKQRHDETPPDAVLSEKTTRTLTSAAAFIKAGES